MSVSVKKKIFVCVCVCVKNTQTPTLQKMAFFKSFGYQCDADHSVLNVGYENSSGFDIGSGSGPGSGPNSDLASGIQQIQENTHREAYLLPSSLLSSLSSTTTTTETTSGSDTTPIGIVLGALASILISIGDFFNFHFHFACCLFVSFLPPTFTPLLPSSPAPLLLL